MSPLDLVKLSALVEVTHGRPEVAVGLIDGPVATDHPDLSAGKIRVIPGKLSGICARAPSFACLHGTFVAGILSARRGSVAPALCPDCTLLVRPIFAEASPSNGRMPSATPAELAAAIIEAIEAGARVVNLSVALQPASTGQRELEEALDFAARRQVILVAAAGNEGTLGSSVITRHPWVIPVVAYDRRGRPMGLSNLSSSVGRRGLGAPGEAITSLGTAGQPLTFGGTSAAAPFVTGAVALLWSEFPAARGSEIKFAISHGHSARRMTVAPPLLDAVAAYRMLRTSHKEKEGTP